MQREFAQGDAEGLLADCPDCPPLSARDCQTKATHEGAERCTKVHCAGSQSLGLKVDQDQPSLRTVGDANVAGLLAAINHTGLHLSFGFPWQNPPDRFAVVNVSGFILLNGFCSVFSDGGFLPRQRFSLLHVETDLIIHELWNDPPTGPTEQPTQNKVALVVECDSGGFIAAGGANGESLVRDFWLYYDQLVMPPKGVALFEVACSFYSEMVAGQTQSDFSFGGRQLICPGVLVALQP